jgi:hypothetical protein
VLSSLSRPPSLHPIRIRRIPRRQNDRMCRCSTPHEPSSPRSRRPRNHVPMSSPCHCGHAPVARRHVAFYFRRHRHRAPCGVLILNFRPAMHPSALAVSGIVQIFAALAIVSPCLRSHRDHDPMPSPCLLSGFRTLYPPRPRTGHVVVAARRTWSGPCVFVVSPNHDLGALRPKNMPQDQLPRCSRQRQNLRLRLPSSFLN